jgi:uncharacterized protein
MLKSGPSGSSVDKIVLDTNVLVSGLLSKSYPYRILYELVANEQVSLLLSPDVLAEYQDVLSRDKFSRFPNFKAKANTALQHINRVGLMKTPDFVLDVITDYADNRFLELAVFAQADYLITGNTRDFTFDKYEDITIISPADYWQLRQQAP